MITPAATLLANNTHRPYSLPTRPWRLRQRWNDLLFAHWRIPAPTLQSLLPPTLEADTFDGSAWFGVIPFWMDHVLTRTLGSAALGVPSTRTFNELNLRTYVRSSVSGLRGVFFSSLDCDSPLAVLGARTLFHLPYFPAVMHRANAPGRVSYRSRRRLTRRCVRYEATYGPVPDSAPLAPSQPGTLAHFLTERYCLFTPSGSRMLVGHIHHSPWPLQPAFADIRINEIPAAHGLTLPDAAPVLHFSRQLEVLLWSLQPDSPP